MRIIVNGQQAFGKAVLDALVARGEEVVGVFCEPDKEGRPADPIKAFAEEKGLPVFQPKSYRKPETHEQMASLSPDLCVMAYVTLFVPEEALYLPIVWSTEIICRSANAWNKHCQPSSPFEYACTCAHASWRVSVFGARRRVARVYVLTKLRNARPRLPCVRAHAPHPHHQLFSKAQGEAIRCKRIALRLCK